ncbi:hypothetical protein [Ectobacillus sp. sgz5001026]|uniref:hypothetical protein n=1 Tax=Ectobacillus sp. sgz5001026 TaxID=3242473 RepID=UPI0036D2EEFE
MLTTTLLTELQEYVDFYKNEVFLEVYAEEIVLPDLSESMQTIELEDYINKKRMPTFNEVLFSFIDNKGTSDTEIYKKAWIDRRHFSKIRSNPDYNIGKNTAIALALALELDEEEIDSLLSAAGYSLSDSDTFDLVIQFCVEKQIYDIHHVNQALDYIGLKPLSGMMK